VARRTSALAEVNRNLEIEVAERSRIAEELRKSAEKLKVFAYSVAHDLKSPSIGIYGLTRLLQKNYSEILSDKGINLCEQIMKASEHVASLVDSINLFIAAKEAPLKIEAVDMAELFQMLNDEFSARLRVRRIKLIVPQAIRILRADKIAILRVFRNLIDNAIKYGGDDLTKIEICYEESHGLHHFTIRDDGVGIQAQESSEIFKLFKRLSDSDKIEGAGLGLAIVKEIIELHKGEVRVERGADGGTFFHVFLTMGL